MAENKQQLNQLRRRVNLWAVVAVALGVTLGAYYLFLGFRYVGAFQESRSLTAQLAQTSTGGLVITDTEALESMRETEERELLSRSEWYSYTDSEDLLGKIAVVAEQSRVDLISVNVGEVSRVVVGPSALQGQPMTLSLAGSQPEDIYRFITLLGTTPPVTAITDLQISGLTGNTTASIKLVFYLLPPASGQPTGR